ncbi:MAG: hypothetical protein ACYSSP_11205 [Planctomycetota bacterium]|jgi:hypothetical protein
MTKAVVSKVIRSVPLRGRYLFSNIRWLKRRPSGSEDDQRLTAAKELEQRTVLYSNQFARTAKVMEGNLFGNAVDYYA